MTDESKRAGRPRTIGGIKIAVTLAAEDVAYLATLGSNRSAAVRRVIAEHRAMKEQQAKEANV